MKTPETKLSETSTKIDSMNEILKSAQELTPLELNNIKLDIKHTVLTPEYLDNLISSGESQNKS